MEGRDAEAINEEDGRRPKTEPHGAAMKLKLTASAGIVSHELVTLTTAAGPPSQDIVFGR